MPLRESLRPLWATAIILFAFAAFALQLITDEPVLGVAGLILLAVPGFAIAWSLAPRPPTWAEVVLASVGTSIVLMVLVGIAAALSPRGLDSSSVAAIELAALVIASAAWLRRDRGRASMPARPRINVKPGSLGLVALGIVLGTAGFVIAMQAAETQTYAGFVQFWSVPPTPGTAANVGIHNAYGRPLDCQVAINVPNQSVIEMQIGTVSDGQSVLRELPRAAVGGTATWQVSLHCSGLDGSTIDRRLTINSPA